MSPYGWCVIHNLGIMTTMIVCVVFVGVWLESPNGLWSLFLCLFFAGYTNDDKKDDSHDS